MGEGCSIMSYHCLTNIFDIKYFYTTCLIVK